MEKKYKSIEFDITYGGDLSTKYKLLERDQEYLKFGNVVYIYKGAKCMYIGQTKNFYERHKQHCAENNGDNRYCRGEYNKVIVAFAASLVTQESIDDIERKLITYITADNEKTNVIIDNNTLGNSVIPYSNQDKVNSDFIYPFWHELYEKGYVNDGNLERVKNSILFKYSPYFELSYEQQNVMNEILMNESNSIVYGLAGTGKSVLITNLAASLIKKDSNLKIAIVVQSNWVESGKKIFEMYGCKNIVVSTPSIIYESKQKFDYILVDEAHRLRRYYSKTNHIRVRDGIFELKQGKPTYNELTYLLKATKRIVLFYDPDQSIRPTDVLLSDFQEIVNNNNFKKFYLTGQFRVVINDKDKSFNSDDYINGIRSVLQIDNKEFNKKVFSDYISNGLDSYFGIVDSISELFQYLQEMEKYHSNKINRVLAGYTRKWVSKGNKDEYDWIEKDNKWQWNSTNENWINKKNSRNEIGCIHAIQGVDLNYVGVIISNDLKIDKTGKIYADKEEYEDRNGIPTIVDFDQDVFNDYVKNIYYVLLTRGISGIRVYFENKDFEKYFKNFMGITN